MYIRVGCLLLMLGALARGQVNNEGNTANIYSLQNSLGIPATNIAVGGLSLNLLTSTPIVADAFGNFTTGGMLSVVNSSIAAQSFSATGPGEGVVAVQVTNSTSPGTITGELACWTSSGTAATCSNTTISGIIGIVFLNGGTGGPASIARMGTAPCTFDSLSPSVTPGHFVINSPNAGKGGQCYDSAAYPVTSQAVGIVITAPIAGVSNVFVFNDSVLVLPGPSGNTTVTAGTGIEAKVDVVANPTFSTSVTSPVFDTALAPVSAAPGATASGSGSLSGTYYYTVSASVDGVGFTVPSPEEPISGLSMSGVSLSWTAVANASSYNVNRGTSSGMENVCYPVSTNSFLDTGCVMPSSVPSAYLYHFSATGSASPPAGLFVAPTLNTTLLGNSLGIGSFVFPSANLPGINVTYNEGPAGVGNTNFQGNRYGEVWNWLHAGPVASGVYPQMTLTDGKLILFDGTLSPGGVVAQLSKSGASYLMAGNLGIGTTTPSSLLSVGSTSQFQVNSTGAIAAATGIFSSGPITLSNLNTVGGVLYTNGSGVLSETSVGTGNQVLLSGASAAPTWSTATYPPTTTANQLLYSSAANTVSGLATANSSVLTTSATGVPGWSGYLPAAIMVANVGDASVASAATTFAGFGYSGVNASEGLIIVPTPKTGTALNLCVYNVSATGGSGAVTVTLRTSGTTDTALVASLPASTVAHSVTCDTTHNVTLSPLGFGLSLKIVNSSGAAINLGGISMQIQ
jgi:hypothetical protein